MASNQINNSAIDSLNAEMAAFDEMVVAQVGSLAWTRRELDALFSRAHGDNWKERIDRVVVLKNDRELLGMREAVVFFTGSVPTFEAMGRNRYRVRAAGYYATIGA